MSALFFIAYYHIYTKYRLTVTRGKPGGLHMRTKPCFTGDTLRRWYKPANCKSLLLTTHKRVYVPLMVVALANSILADRLNRTPSRGQ